MNNNIVMSDLRSFLPIPMIIHPFLIALYFVLALYTQNISEASPGVIWRPLILLLLVTASLLVILRSLTRNLQRSALIVSLVLLIFLSYGHVYNFLRNDLNLKDVALGEVYIFRHSFLSVLWIILGILGTFIILRFKKTHALTLFLNSVSIIMLVFPVFDIGLYIYREQVYGSKQNVQATSLNLPDDGRLPDIYFIVLDAYGRKDVLQDTFGLDNSKFLAELQDLGFYVVECSQSNYARTRLSIASTLNMDYVQNLLPEEGQRELNAQLRPYMSDNAARLLLEEIGYKTVEFENGFPWLKWKNVSHYLQKGEKTSIQLQLATGMNPFEELFLNTTLVRAAVDLGLSGAAISSAPSHRETVLYALETLPKLPRISEPKFVYAHLILPHPPFIFGPNGEEVELGSREVEINDISFYADEKM
ncbi:MAG TPA: hypothetical protein VFO70_01335, partial [Chitinophagaceae bacterium]|nr:hypothetical protein [Chitinophagaceae bacterium]